VTTLVVADLGIRAAREGVDMSAEVVQVVEQSAPYLTAALAAYGGAVLRRTEDALADVTANQGRRLLQAVWRRCAPERRQQLEEAAEEASQDPDSADAQAALRQHIRRALCDDIELLREFTNLLPSSAPQTFTASGDRSIAAQNISGIAITGDNANVQR
jgi:hypothetical protein